jgi:cell division protein FtsZ
VATGIGTGMEATEPKPVKLVKKNDGEVDYSALDRPAVMRNNQVANDKYSSSSQPQSEDLDYLDIPAFLRRQAD